MTQKTAKEKILDAAAVLFYNHGIASTGINSITDKAQVAKMSLYNNFPAKSDLVAAYIHARHQEWLDLYAKRLAQANSPRDAILAVFAAYQDHAECAYESGFRGCGLLNAAAEFPANSPERLAVKQHKEQIEQILREQLQQLLMDSAHVEYLASLLSFLLEGAIMRAGLEGSSQKMQLAKDMAAQLLDRELAT